MTSSCPSGPPNESTSSASRRPGGAGSVDGATPPLLRTASDGSSWGRCPAGGMWSVGGGPWFFLSQGPAGGHSPAPAWHPPVDVHDLAGGGWEPVRQEGDDG